MCLRPASLIMTGLSSLTSGRITVTSREGRTTAGVPGAWVSEASINHGARINHDLVACGANGVKGQALVGNEPRVTGHDNARRASAKHPLVGAHGVLDGRREGMLGRLG